MAFTEPITPTQSVLRDLHHIPVLLLFPQSTLHTAPVPWLQQITPSGFEPEEVLSLELMLLTVCTFCSFSGSIFNTHPYDIQINLLPMLHEKGGFCSAKWLDSSPATATKWSSNNKTNSMTILMKLLHWQLPTVSKVWCLITRGWSECIARMTIAQR